MHPPRDTSTTIAGPAAGAKPAGDVGTAGAASTGTAAGRVRIGRGSGSVGLDEHAVVGGGQRGAVLAVPDDVVEVCGLEPISQLGEAVEALDESQRAGALVTHHGSLDGEAGGQRVEVVAVDQHVAVVAA